MAESWTRRIQKYRQLWNTEPEFLKLVEQLISQNGGDVMSSVTGYVTAPLLCGYVAWVVWEAVRTGKQRLYFLARDGYYLKKAADIFCEEWNINIECRYLYCSRYAWRGAVYHLDNEQALDYITLGGLEAGFAKMMQRAGLSKGEIQKVAGLLGYTADSRKRFTPEERKELRKKLSECDLFMKLMNEHSKTQFCNAIAYLTQEGLFDDIPYALVDSGWTGSLQKSLIKLLRSADCNTVPEGYYFGMYSKPIESEAGIYHTYYFSPTAEIKKKVYFNNNLFECVYSAPHGMTVGYEEQDGKWMPVLEHKENPNKDCLIGMESLLYAFMKEYAITYSKRIADARENSRYEAEKKRLERLICLLMAKPTKEEAQAYGNFVFCDDVIGEEKQTLAANLTWEELKNGFLLAKLQKRLGIRRGKAEGIGRESAWPEGSIALLGKKNAFWHCALCEYVRLTVETWNNRRQIKK